MGEMLRLCGRRNEQLLLIMIDSYNIKFGFNLALNLVTFEYEFSK